MRRQGPSTCAQYRNTASLDEMKGFFKEKQRFTQWWLWLIVLAILLLVIVIFMKGMYIQFILGKPWGDQPMSDVGLIFMSIAIIAVIGGVVWLLFTAELTIEIHDRAVYYRFAPFMGRNHRIGLEDIESWEIKKYKPIAEHGAYGWRTGLGKRTTFNVKGRIGLVIKQKNNKILMLGTQMPGEIKEAMEYEMEKMNNPDYQ